MPHRYPSVHRAVRTTDRMYTTTILVSGNCHSRNSQPIPVAATTNTNAQSRPRRAPLLKNPVFVIAASLLPLFTGNYSSFFKGKQGKSASAKVGGDKIKRFPESRNRSPKDCVNRGLGQHLNKQKNHSFRESRMDGFSHLYISAMILIRNHRVFSILVDIYTAI